MFQDSDDGVIISLHVQPNAPKSCIIGEYNGALKIKIKALPVDGKANTEIINFFSNLLAIPKSKIEILKGGKSKLKKVLILGLTAAQIKSKLR
jgi:uncharacterized protein (TIGR00251 family)